MSLKTFFSIYGLSAGIFLILAIFMPLFHGCGDDDDNGGDDSFLNMVTGGKLALAGNADASLADFLDLIEGTDAIRYWDTTVHDWADITGATPGTDYTLEYLTTGDLAGYTLLTVGTAPGYAGDANHDYFSY